MALAVLDLSCVVHLAPSDLYAIGYTCGIIGAIFLAKSFMAKRTADILRESATAYGRNLFLFRSFSYQVAEARWGGFFLALAYALQIIAVLYPHDRSACPRGTTWFLIVLLALVGIVINWVSKHRARNFLRMFTPPDR